MELLNGILRVCLTKTSEVQTIRVDFKKFPLCVEMKNYFKLSESYLHRN